MKNKLLFSILTMMVLSCTDHEGIDEGLPPELYISCLDSITKNVPNTLYKYPSSFYRYRDSTLITFRKAKFDSILPCLKKLSYLAVSFRHKPNGDTLTSINVGGRRQIEYHSNPIKELNSSKITTKRIEKTNWYEVVYEVD